MSRKESTAQKQSQKHDHDIDRIRLKRSDFHLLKIPKSDRAIGTPHVEPTVNLRLITKAIDWVAKERERLLKETRQSHVEKK